MCVTVRVSCTVVVCVCVCVCVCVVGCNVFMKPIHQYRITGFLGQGQFGKVQKGEWQSSGGRGTITVAIKLLKENSGEEDKVKFLQEVAIMGQFSHPNVIKLHGIVSTDKPVSPACPVC